MIACIPIVSFTMDSLVPLITLLLVSLLIWFWLDNRRSHEIAVGVCKHICRQANVQLLDDTVSLCRIGVRRNARGRLRFRRMFNFDYSDDASNREQGYIIMLGTDLEAVTILGQTTMVN
jgi:hypothetical protein